MIKRIVTIVLPGLGALYALLWVVWDAPNPVAVLGTLAALTFCGGLLMATSTERKADDYDGVLTTVGEDPDTGLPHLELNITGDPTQLVNKDTLLIKSVDGRKETSRPKQGI